MISKLNRISSFLKKVPGGRWIFSRLIGWFVPYAGPLRANIQEMMEGRAVLTMGDRRAIRNHLNSIHALALANFGELTANLALVTLCPPDGRFIVTRMEVDYLKKARGELTACCDVPADLPWRTIERTAATANLIDSEGDVVTRVTVYFKLGIRPPAPTNTHE